MGTDRASPLTWCRQRTLYFIIFSLRNVRVRNRFWFGAERPIDNETAEAMGRQIAAKRRRCDLRAHRLGQVIVDRVLGPEAEAASRPSVSPDAAEFAVEAVKGGPAVAVPD